VLALSELKIQSEVVRLYEGQAVRSMNNCKKPELNCVYEFLYICIFGPLGPLPVSYLSLPFCLLPLRPSVPSSPLVSPLRVILSVSLGFALRYEIADRRWTFDSGTLARRYQQTFRQIQ
jgi:hypothetical protein